MKHCIEIDPIDASKIVYKELKEYAEIMAGDRVRVQDSNRGVVFSQDPAEDLVKIDAALNALKLVIKLYSPA